MAKIDRLIAAQVGAEAPAASRPAGPGARPAALPPVSGQRPAGRVGTLVRLALGVALGVGVAWWPYGRLCGVALFAYLGAVATVVVAGLWSAGSSWRRRMPVAHTLAIVLVLWGLALAAREVLPRVGYAREAASWLCPPSATP